MIYALNLNEENRVLSVTFDKYAPEDHPRVEELPEGNILDYKYEKGEFVYEPKPVIVDNTALIAELKQKLTDTDYIVIKIAEGVATWEDYPGVKEQRQQWREEINRLEEIVESTEE